MLAIFYALQAVDIRDNAIDGNRMQEMITGLGSLGESICDPLFFEIDQLIESSKQNHNHTSQEVPQNSEKEKNQ